MAPDPAPTAGPAPVETGPPTGPIPIALAQAASSGQPVVVDAQTTQTHQLTANPDGTLSAVDNPLPVRVKQQGVWVPLDATLAQNSDGSYSPAATPSGITLSGGGAGPLATLTDPAGHTLSYSLPFTLPSPTVTGSTALYSSVLTGVDLSVSVTDQGGFSDVLIVHDAAAAADPGLAKLTLAASTQGLTLSTDTAGDLAATAADGSLSFTAPKPVMWDSSTTGSTSTGTTAAARSRALSPATTDTADATASSASGPGTGAQVAPVAMTVTPTAVTLTPNAALLSGTGTRYPVFVDPYTNPAPAVSGNYDEVYSSSTCSNSPQFNVPQSQGEGVGYQFSGGACGSGLERSYYTLSLAGIPASAVVQSSKVTAPDTYAASWDCAHHQPVTLHTTGSINSTTDWNNKPGTNDGTYAAVPTTVLNGKNPNSSCSGADAVFTVTNQVTKLLANGVSSWTLALFGDESQTSGNDNYLRFSTKISINTVFDVPPDTPSNVHTVPDTSLPGAGCNNTSTGWIGAVGANSLSFLANSRAEIFGEKAALNLDVWDNNLDNGSGGATVKQLSTTSYTITDAGGTASQQRSFTLQDGHTYGWGVQAVDDNNPAHLTSPWVSECHFGYDATPPTTSIVGDNPSFPRIGNGAGNPVQYAGAATTFAVTATDPLPADTCTLGTCAASGIGGFIWRLDTQPTPINHTGSVIAPTSTGTDAGGDPTANATISLTLASWGVHTLYIAALDKAGNPSQNSASYTFYVPWNPSKKIIPGDVNNDGVADLLATTQTGDLDLIPGGANPDAAPQLASTKAQTPGYASNHTDTWNNYWLAHRGSLVGGAVDDLFAFNHATGHLYAVLNDFAPTGTATFSGNQAPIDFSNSKPPCATTDTTRCSTGTAGAQYDQTDFANVKQIAAPGDVYNTGTPTLLTAETIPGTSIQHLWLFNTKTGPALLNPVLLGTGDWSHFTLITPGTVGTKPALWARDNTTGTLYSFDLTPDPATGLPPLLTAPTTTLQSALLPATGHLCADDSSSSATDGTTVDIYTCNNTAAQTWTLRADHTVRVLGKCLEASGGGTANSTPIDQTTCTTSTAQQWTQGSNGSLINTASGKCLADPAATTTIGTQLILWTCNGGNEQNWAAQTGSLPAPADPATLPLTLPPPATPPSPPPATSTAPPATPTAIPTSTPSTPPANSPNTPAPPPPPAASPPSPPTPPAWAPSPTPPPTGGTSTTTPAPPPTTPSTASTPASPPPRPGPPTPHADPYST
ncbi:ricin-type beta-trefoil lectin domain protein [Streptacidiphilus sp. N1-12]|uniref:Ricin-type beta-trefoil lectin domain protein n=2 Tax=Streptacidiphilus alkalitolerans TaxID=3342712 RepID=A0ABV6V7R0_9ACTN